MSEQNFEQNKQFLGALPAGRISHFTSRIYPSLSRKYKRPIFLRCNCPEELEVGQRTKDIPSRKTGT